MKLRTPSHGTVIAYLALFAALGGTGFAVSQLPKNSVGSKQIGSNAVKDPEVADSAVDSSEVENASLLAEDFAGGQLEAGPPGGQGPPGEQGPRGETGLTGAVGPTFGAMEVNGSANPNSLESSGVTPGAGVVNFTTPTAGQVLAMADAVGVIVNCTPDAVPRVGLYLDGQPVQGSRRQFVDNVAADLDVFGISTVVTAGTHKLEIGAACDGGASVPTFIGGNDPNRSLGAVLLGS